MSESPPSADVPQGLDPHLQAEPPGAAPDRPTLPTMGLHPVRRRLTDRQAVALLGGWLLFRAVTQRVGLGVVPRLIGPAPWAVPLLNNAMLLLLAAGTGVEGRPGMFAATAAASLLLSTISGCILYWAGYRFGPKLAEMAERSGSTWASIWNPRQVERAHRWIERWGVLAVFAGRVLEWITTPVMLVAGSSQMTFGKFLAAHTAGAAVFAAGSLWLGGAAQHRWPWLDDRIRSLAPWALRVGLVLVALFLLGALLSRGKPHQDPPPA